MKNKTLAKQVKKLVFSNKFTLNKISLLLDEPLDVCVSAFESAFNTPIPAGLLIVGNEKARKTLEENIKNSIHMLLCGPNGTGKDISLQEISEKLNLEINKSVPLKQADIVADFGKGPLHNNNNMLFVIDVDSLPKKKYSVLKQYITKSGRPIVLMAGSKDRVNKNILKLLKVVTFSPPSPTEIGRFLEKKYNWKGNIQDIYDDDMRVVLSRALIDSDIKTIKLESEINSSKMAFMVASGFADVKDFENMKEPLWWVIRWLGYNQKRKFPDNKTQLENLQKLAYIDKNKFVYSEDYLRKMLLGLKTSSRRNRFLFPPWPRKNEKKEEPIFVKVKQQSKKEKEEKILEAVDFSRWL